MRYALGADPRMLFVPREERGLVAFLSPLRCYVHRVDRWWHEGVSREVFTALALGLPVLCDRASFCADYIDDGVDGLLYGSADEALARLKELRHAPSFADSVGRAARAKAARLFDPPAIATAWRKLVRDDAQSPSAAPPSATVLRVAS
jgi:glycosyltransferase involved in cell wall biosynthesis